MSTLETYFSKREINRRALMADLGGYLAEEPAFLSDVTSVADAMEPRLAFAIHARGWIVEPSGGDLATKIASRYGNGSRRQRIIAIILREAAAALHFVPAGVRDPHNWAEAMVMNVGSVAYSAAGESAGRPNRSSRAALDMRERGCRAIARRGASKCIVCGSPVVRVGVGGGVVNREIQPFACSGSCEEDVKRWIDSMNEVFARTAWLLSEAMTLRVDLLPFG